MTWEKIFEVGGDGGSISVMGRRGDNGPWSFLMVCDESTFMSMTDEFIAEELSSKDYSESWEGIIEKLDAYPWPHLYPLGPFHEVFKERIWMSLMERKGGSGYADKWANFCGPTIACDSGE